MYRNDLIITRFRRVLLGTTAVIAASTVVPALAQQSGQQTGGD